MNDFLTAVIVLFALAQGVGIGYILWAPHTAFKQGFIDGLTLKFLWGKK